MGRKAYSGSMDYSNEFSEGFQETSLGKIYYKHHNGNGRTLVLIHGLGGTTRAWLRLVNFFPEDLNVYMIDLLGHGKSDAPDIDYTLEKQVQILSEFITGQDIKNCVLFGHSYGGWTAISYVLSGGRYAGLVLESCAGLKDYFDYLRKNDGLKKREERVMKTLSYLNTNRMFVFKSIMSHELDDREFTQEEIRTIPKPTLILWGSSDDIIEPEFAKIFNRCIKGSELAMVEGAGHDAHYTNPREVAGIVLGFLGYS